MIRQSRRGTVAALLFAIALICTDMTVQAQPGSGVIFAALLPTPLADGDALRTAGGARIHASLKIENAGSVSRRFSTYRSLFPELVNATGAVVPFEYGANRSRGPRESDYPLLDPGQTLTIPLEGILTFQGSKLEWRGSDGNLGFWNIVEMSGPYRFRLAYRQMQPTAGPFEGSSETLSGVWFGEHRTNAVDLALKFAR
ncbi:MAG TPA: hypothetical protein VD863_14615 [Bradyrhizobium sp.]|nr:hypothetical protein [Bradyrhizobium sp.]